MSELKQSLAAAYDVLLGRAGGLGKAKQLLSAINDLLEQDHKYNASDVLEFIEQLGLLPEADQILMCRELSHSFFSVMGQGPLASKLPEFLVVYGRLVEGQGYAWSYAETIASNMREVFRGDGTSPNEKAQALHLAIRAAYYMNRFAAMDDCRSMVTSVRDEALGFCVASVLLNNRETFISGVEPSECNSEAVSNALRQIQQQ